jgi:3-isopropylmalate dehydrogenase
VIVTSNMFGDIITDLGAMTQGGLGVAAGGNINPEGLSMFEPIGGSAPQFKGMGVINPIAAICSAGMMLQNLGEDEAAQKIEDAAKHATEYKLEGVNVDDMGCSTAEVGDYIAAKVAE